MILFFLISFYYSSSHLEFYDSAVAICYFYLLYYLFIKFFIIYFMYSK